MSTTPRPLLIELPCDITFEAMPGWDYTPEEWNAAVSFLVANIVVQMAPELTPADKQHLASLWASILLADLAWRPPDFPLHHLARQAKIEAGRNHPQ